MADQSELGLVHLTRALPADGTNAVLPGTAAMQDYFFAIFQGLDPVQNHPLQTEDFGDILNHK